MFKQISHKNILLLNKIYNIIPVASYKTKSLPDLTKVRFNPDLLIDKTALILQDRYKVSRKNYATPNGKDISFFESVLQTCNVLRDPSETQGYNIDFLGKILLVVQTIFNKIL